MIIIGLMSGTSADGIEAVAAEIDPAAASARLLAGHRTRYDGDDALATAVARTVRTIMDALREAVSPLKVRPINELGVPAAAREALALAILGAYRLAGLPNTLPRCTGASRAVSAGAVHAP